MFLRIHGQTDSQTYKQSYRPTGLKDIQTHSYGFYKITQITQETQRHNRFPKQTNKYIRAYTYTHKKNTGWLTDRSRVDISFPLVSRSFYEWSVPGDLIGGNEGSIIHVFAVMKGREEREEE